MPELGPAETQTRFILAFFNFISVFAKPAHPLVIFLDDLQWADPASLRLLDLVATNPDSKHLLIIGAYRDNEVTPSHPLMIALDSMKKAAVAVQTLVLGPLNLQHIEAVVAETVNSSAQATHELAEIIFSKTAGNPFFATQLLRSLYDDGQIHLDASQGGWRWDIQALRRAAVTNNVIELMTKKIMKLPAATQEMLQRAACVGNVFSLDMLATVSRAT